MVLVFSFVAGSYGRLSYGVAREREREAET